MIISAFQPNTVITDERFLFGHNQPNRLLDIVLEKVQIGTNTQLLGERRIGKTSVLHCACNIIRQRYSYLLPVYLNFRQHPMVKGYEDTHRLLLAAIHVAYIQRASFSNSDPGILPGFGLTTSDNIDEHYELLGAATVHEIQRYIEQYVKWLSQLKLGVVLLFDEYESMMVNTFEGRRGSFFFIRDLSAQGTLVPDAPKPLTYVIAGTTPWIKLCDRIGSPEFNNTGATLYVSPLLKEDFEMMWNHCVSNSSQIVQDRISDAGLSVDHICDLAGGWPFFGKIIGQAIGGSGGYDEEDIYHTLSQHFMVNWSRITESHLQDFLLNLSPMKPSIARDLLQRGLIRQSSEDTSYVPSGSLWTRYVLEQAGDAQTSSFPTSSVDTEGDSLVNDIVLLMEQVIDLVLTINETCDNYGKEFVFKPTNDDIRIFEDLKTPAFARKQFTHFAKSLYLLIFERTIDHSPTQNKEIRLERLPNRFRRSHSLVQEVDALRHEYAAHLTHVDTWNPGKNSITVGEVLEKYLGSKASPSDSQFLELQIGVLKSLVNYLNDLHIAIQRDFGAAN